LCGANVSTAVLYEGIGHDSEVAFLEAFVCSDAISAHIFTRKKLDMKGSHFMVPFYAPLMAFSASLWFLAFVFLVVSVATWATREATGP
jgi:hypothetical protein